MQYNHGCKKMYRAKAPHKYNHAGENINHRTHKQLQSGHSNTKTCKHSSTYFHFLHGKVSLNDNVLK